MEKKVRRYYLDVSKRQSAARLETGRLAIMDVVVELGLHETQLRR